MINVKVLVLGAGNISCGYDWDNEFIKTHCKALANIKNLSVSIYDTNETLAFKSAKKYNFLHIDKFEKINFNFYDWIVIASSTDTHFTYLKRAILEKIPLVICEKPIASSLDELKILEDLYKMGQTKVIVNYIRRFQKKYIELRKLISAIDSIPSSISVTYQRGFSNNFSHASDLLEFLFGKFSLTNINVFAKFYDELTNDPTISFSALLNNNIQLIANGIRNAKYSYFEIEIFFSSYKIHIAKNGNEIQWYSSEEYQTFYHPLKYDCNLSSTNVLENSMVDVYNFVSSVYANHTHDNFLSSIKNNNTLLKIIKCQN